MTGRLPFIVCLFFIFQMRSQTLEDFNGTFPPMGWLIADNGTGTGESWKYMVTPPWQPCEGTGAVIIDREEIGSGNTSEDWLISPLVTVGTNDILSFCSRTTVPGEAGTLFQIRISATSQSNLAGFTTIWTETETQIGFQFQQKYISLSPYIGQSIYIAFVRIFTQPTGMIDGDRWILDNITFVDGLTAMSFESENNLAIFPNPIHDLINISSDATIRELRIINYLGQLVISHSFSGNNTGIQLDAKALTTGNYIVEIQSDRGTTRKKIIKL